MKIFIIINTKMDEANAYHMQHNGICYLFLKSKANKYDVVKKMVALKAKKGKKKKRVCPSPWIVPFLFMVKIEIIKCIG